MSKTKYICTRKGCRLRDKNGNPYALEVGKVYSFTDEQAAKLVNKIRKADVVIDNSAGDKLAELNAENAKQVEEIAVLGAELAEATGHVKNALKAQKDAEKRAGVAEKALAKVATPTPPAPSTPPTPPTPPATPPAPGK